MEDIITYESLYEIVRNEKTNDSLQPISEKLTNQLVSYLKTKIQVYKEAKENKQQDVEKIRTQVLSVRRLIKNLYELRERKIINLAISKSRTNSSLEEEKNLLNYEKNMMGENLVIIDKFRTEVLLNLINAKTPYKEETNKLKEPELSQSNQENKEEKEIDEKIELNMIRFLIDVPKFLGKQKEIYGPFKPGDIANLDKDIVNILVNKKAAELIISE